MLARATHTGAYHSTPVYTPHTDRTVPAAVEVIDDTTSPAQKAYFAKAWAAIRAEAERQGRWYTLRSDLSKRERQCLEAVSEVDERRNAADRLVD